MAARHLPSPVLYSIFCNNQSIKVRKIMDFLRPYITKCDQEKNIHKYVNNKKKLTKTKSNKQTNKQANNKHSSHTIKIQHSKLERNFVYIQHVAS